MEIAVTVRHTDKKGELDRHIKDTVKSELSVFTRVENVRVILDAEKHRRRAEIVVQAADHIRLEADAEADDIYVAFDKAVDKMAKQLRKQRDKVQDHKAEHLGELDSSQLK